MTREQQIDKAYSYMISKCDIIEEVLGERTNVETIHEGRFIFKYEVLFCDKNNDVHKRKVIVNLKTTLIKVI